MDGYTYIEILVEDDSGGILAKQIMDKYVADKDNIIYKIHSFKGIGKIPRKIKGMSQVKSKRLLTYLKNMFRTALSEHGNAWPTLFIKVGCRRLKEMRHLIMKSDSLNVNVQGILEIFWISKIILHRVLIILYRN